MNTFIQDLKLPIYITLNYDGYKTMKIPLNPEDLTMNIPSANETVNILGLGDVSIPKDPQLRKLTIKSVLWQDINYIPSSQYILWLKHWQKSKKPANLVITKLNYSMTVICTNFNYSVRAGEEDDIYYELELTEYKDYGAKIINGKTDKLLLNKVLGAIDDYTSSPVLVEIPRPNRGNTMHHLYSERNPYTVSGEGETWNEIGRKFSPSAEGIAVSEIIQSFIDNNKEVASDNAENDKIPSGTQLNIPEKLQNKDTVSLEENK